MNNIVESKRTIHTPSKFAKESLLFLEEIGTSKSLKNHISQRIRLNSYLLFIVLEGYGNLVYNNKKYKLRKGDIVFIDCNINYSHASDNWTIKWIHFNGLSMNKIYQKYLERAGKCCYKSKDFQKYISLIDEIEIIINSSEYILDIYINEKISSLLSLIMNETVYKIYDNNRKYNINEIKTYIDNNYDKSISLNDLSNKFYINKFYLTRLFKSSFGKTINNYIIEKRITKAKSLLRFSDHNIKNIASLCGFSNLNYFSRYFKYIEGVTPTKYKNKWK